MEWRKIVGLSRYEVSESGQVRLAVDVKMPNGSIRFCAGMLLKPQKKKPVQNYPSSVVREGFYLRGDDGKGVNLHVHRMVAMAFCQRPDGCNVVCHVDGNTANNHYSNLYWGTYKQNALDRWKHGTMCNGEKAPAAKLDAAQVREIRTLIADKADLQEIADRFKVKLRTIKAIKSRQNWAWLT